MERRGSITVFLALVLSLLLALIGAAFESVRVSCARVHILNGTDVGLYSLFAQYDRDLLDTYEIFGLHPASPSQEVPVAQSYEIFQEYMEPLLDVKGISMELGVGGVSGYTLMTDQNGQAFWKQAVQVQKESLGKKGIQWLLGQVQENAGTVEDYEKTWEDAREGEALEEYDQAIEQAQTAEQEVSQEEMEEPGQEDGLVSVPAESQVPAETVENPIQTIRELMKMGILQLVLEDPQFVSWTSVEKGQLLSERTLEKGFAMGVREEDMSASDRLLFGQYLLERMGNYRNPASGMMKNQLEYILCGKSSDGENLKATANQLLLIREGMNFAYLLSDPASRAQASAMAAAIASAFLFPPAAAIIEKALLLCWAFGESVLDLRELFAGGKIGLWKSEQTWQLSLDNLIHLPQMLDSGRKSDSEGMDYRQYLQILLFLRSQDTQVMRAMDQVELEIQARKGETGFRLDHCLTALEVSVEVQAQSTELDVTRQYGYVF